MAKERRYWTRTAAGRAFARSAIQGWNAKRESLPKCGAKNRTTGEPCRNLAMTNGRCSVHGGKTPSGEGWHRPSWPKASAPGSEDKLNRKLRDLDRAARKRARRLAAMTPEELERYESWQRTHKVGKPSARAAARQARDNSKALLAIVEQPAASPSPAHVVLQEQIDLARQRAIRLEIESSEEGIFG